MVDVPCLRFPGWASDEHPWVQLSQTHPPNWEIAGHSQSWTCFSFPGGVSKWSSKLMLEVTLLYQL